MTAATNREIEIGLSNLEFIEEDAIHRSAVVLSGVNQHMVHLVGAVEPPDDLAHPYEVRPNTDDGHDLHHDVASRARSRRHCVASSWIISRIVGTAFLPEPRHSSTLTEGFTVASVRSIDSGASPSSMARSVRPNADANSRSRSALVTASAGTR